MLREGKRRGLFDEYGVENAESLTFENNSFDVLFCKEAFHHFPRPIIALYEMIRVAKHAVVLIEPNDNQKITFRFLIDALKLFAFRLINKKFKPCFSHLFQQIHMFEDSGNYVYSLSNREVNKIAHAMDLGDVAYYEFNDSYVKGVEFEEAVEHNHVFKELKRKIEVLDNKGNHSLTTTVIFKNEVDLELKKSMITSGYKFLAKKRNPII
jgi:SAM-dependent methyltransferase